MILLYLSLLVAASFWMGAEYRKNQEVSAYRKKGR